MLHMMEKLYPHPSGSVQMYQAAVVMKKHPCHTSDIPKWRESPHRGDPHMEDILTWRGVSIGTVSSS